MARIISAVLARLLHWGPARAYRPERHYMRGPGPKCRAKSDPLAA